jgi:hypothetical protein
VQIAASGSVDQLPEAGAEGGEEQKRVGEADYHGAAPDATVSVQPVAELAERRRALRCAVGGGD